MKNDLESFNEIWERESAKTIKLLESLPVDGYDFRPDPESRSLGELAWHLERPRKVQELSTGFERVRRDPRRARDSSVAEANLIHFHHRGTESSEFSVPLW